MSEGSRFSAGGFSPRFLVTRTDGKPCRPSARYMVMDGSGADPHALAALKVYAESVRHDNHELAADLDRMLGGDWPKEMAQHKDAV